jgi:CRISPR-associated protein Cmr3
MTHHLLTLQPTDVLFFRDGRPMDGASSGHGAAWPLPHILDSALHHALRRASFTDFTPHSHTVKRSGQELNPDREQYGRQFGSLQSAGPFPVSGEDTAGQWFFPRPADATLAHGCAPTHRPLAEPTPGSSSSLHSGLRPVVNTLPPSKDKPGAWFSTQAFQAYLDATPSPEKAHFRHDQDIFSAEHNIGIGIDPESGTTNDGQFYSASYLRLNPEFRIGLVASCHDKGKGGKTPDIDLLEKTFLNSGHQNHIIAGGQQRTCTVLREKVTSLPLPFGKIDGFHRHQGVWHVKWVLLTPAIFPELRTSANNPTRHPGGWLPSWIHPETLQIQLKAPQSSTRGEHEGRTAWRKRVAKLLPIDARLTAALIHKPIPVTGWALTDTHHDTGALIDTGGARATHLAVPAGSVYYFECPSAEAASQLAAALNWHGSDLHPATIRNRRSALMGEKGFGLGVCGTWSFHPDDIPGHPTT